VYGTATAGSLTSAVSDCLATTAQAESAPPQTDPNPGQADAGQTPPAQPQTQAPPAPTKPARTAPAPPAKPAQLRTTRAPKIVGAVRVGSRLTVRAPSLSPRPTRIAYTWKVGTRVVSHASALAVRSTWKGKRITVSVTATRRGYASRTLTVTAGTVRARR
jgi:hypothetical protein